MNALQVEPVRILLQESDFVVCWIKMRRKAGMRQQIAGINAVTYMFISSHCNSYLRSVNVASFERVGNL